MKINYSYDHRFNRLMKELKRELPEEMFNLEGIGKQLDLSQFSKDYFTTNTTVADVSVDSNSNVCDMSVTAYEAELKKPQQRLDSLYMLWKYSRKMFGSHTANRLVRRQIIGDFYINDFHGFSTKPYCFNFSTYDIHLMGSPFVNKIDCGTPKHLSSFMGHLANFVSYASNQMLGAVGLSDLFIVMSWYADKILTGEDSWMYASEEAKWKVIKQEMQSFIYNVNQPFKLGLESPFTNVSIMDTPFLENLASDYNFIDGKKANIETVKQLQIMYIDLMNDILKVTPATFPVTTACFAVDENNDIIDKDFLELISEKNLETGFMNIYTGSSSTLSSCCRLRSEMKEYFNSFGAGSTKIGSLGVVTLNLPRLAMRHMNGEGSYQEMLIDLASDAVKVLQVKRHIIEKRIETNSLPLYTLSYMDLKKQYSTLGINGMNEAMNILGFDVMSDEGQGGILLTLDTLNGITKGAERLTSFPHNVEQTPSENSSIKIAKKDKIMGFNANVDFYSNQFIPLIHKADLLDRIAMQGKFDKHMSGGSILHINTEEGLSNKEDMKALIQMSAKKGVIYFGINYNLQQCANKHMSVGKKDVCDVCGAPITKNFIRVVGFLTCVDHWHQVRREQDYPNRQMYKGEHINELSE